MRGHRLVPSGAMTSDPGLRGRWFCSCGTPLKRTPDSEEAMRLHLADLPRVDDVYTRPGVEPYWETSNTLEFSPTLEPLREDCSAPGFSGEGRCLEPAGDEGLCVDHLFQQRGW